ncbi:ABC1 kinase family protein [Metabacillus halosaccharovorans]|uniref:AarF/ABC1/UbiB kinase family protein n=1 Tax=Metabacillus halosaccharovorans TaxID=930124 RepID=A0ABT3DF45_9BACI|nr:AarF/ABC1/UbiB kinase family protein [Metabacillus halosaccharovorans]MCV9885488.1 AarF/ABC1/UbiB kinase family protein [Metabacillus halosaccharovorans]
MAVKSKWKRIYKVLTLFFSIFLKIYWYKLRKKSDSEWEKLWLEIGKKFRKTLFELEGLLIKIGQILSIRSDLLPHAFISQIQDLTDKVPPSNWDEIKKQLENEWGESLDYHLQSIDQHSIASASIGEVYKGVLKNGTTVAIKVQRPHIQSIIQTDFRTLRIIIWFADHFVPVPKGFIQFNVLFKELKQVIEQELDFQLEMKSLIYFKERYKSSSDIVQIPSVYKDLCTSKILVMEWVEGIRLSDEHQINQLPFSREELAKRLISVFLPQWLEPGLFHADPHPGNILFSPEGKVIMLDLGMVGEISKKDATNFQTLIGSVLAKDYTKAVECLYHLEFLHSQDNSRTMEKLMAELVSFDPSQLMEADLLKLKLEMNDLIQALPIQVPTRFVFLGRAVVTIEGNLRNLVPDQELLELGKPVFMKWLQSQGSNKWSFLWQWAKSQPLFHIIHSVTDFLQAPKKYEMVKETEQRRLFQFTIIENNKKRCFQLVLIGLIGVGYSIVSSQDLLWQLSGGLTILSAVGYGICGIRLKKWMKYMQEGR